MLDIQPKGILYVLILKTEAQQIKVGALGELEFNGTYAYVGSDQRGGRLTRHMKKNKIMKWHIDYLTNVSTVLGAWTFDLPQKMESELANKR